MLEQIQKEKGENDIKFILFAKEKQENKEQLQNLREHILSENNGSNNFKVKTYDQIFPFSSHFHSTVP